MSSDFTGTIQDTGTIKNRVTKSFPVVSSDVTGTIRNRVTKSFAVVSSDFTGTIESCGTIQPALSGATAPIRCCCTILDPTLGGEADSKNLLSSYHEELNIDIIHHHPKHDFEGIRSRNPTNLSMR